MYVDAADEVFFSGSAVMKLTHYLTGGSCL